MSNKDYLFWSEAKFYDPCPEMSSLYIAQLVLASLQNGTAISVLQSHFSGLRTLAAKENHDVFHIILLKADAFFALRF